MAKYRSMCDLMRIAKAFADENLIRVLLAVRGGELCACQITELFRLAPSTMSKHLSIIFTRQVWSIAARRGGGSTSGFLMGKRQKR